MSTKSDRAVRELTRRVRRDATKLDELLERRASLRKAKTKTPKRAPVEDDEDDDDDVEDEDDDQDDED